MVARILLLFVSAWQVAAADATQELELAKLQGKWTVVTTAEVERQGVYERTHMLTIKGDQWHVKHEDGVEAQLTVTVDPTSTPKGIDHSRNGRKRIGIYKIEGDTLTVCFGLDQRPNDFTIKTDASTVVTIYKRIHK